MPYRELGQNKCIIKTIIFPPRELNNNNCYSENKNSATEGIEEQYLLFF